MAGELEQAHKALRELGKALKNLPNAPAPEQVHKLRTAARRVEALATALPLGGKKKTRELLDAIEPLRKAAGGIRDIDVLKIHARKLNRLAAGDAIARLIEQLDFSRLHSAAALKRELGSRREKTRAHLKQYAKLLDAAKSGAQHQSEIHPAAMRALRELATWPPLDAANLHGFRLKVKRLRYILQLDSEAAPGLVEALGQVQHFVGDWHDWQQLEERARELLDAQKDAATLARIEQATKRRYTAALKAANSLRATYLLPPRATGI
jgi:CHAD domain-containing protein